MDHRARPDFNTPPGAEFIEAQDRQELIKDLNRDYDLELTEHLTAAELESLLAEKLNVLIQSDFNGLIRLLYRIDINEARLRHLLKENAQENAGRIVASLIMERQWQKIQSRRQFKAPDPGSGEERW